MTKKENNEVVEAGMVTPYGVAEIDETEIERFDSNRTVNLSVLTTGTNVSYCSLPAETREEKINLLNKIQVPNKKMKEVINTTLEVENIYAEVITLEDGTQAPRVLLILKDGTTVQSVSMGVFNGIAKIMAMMGQPPFNPVLKLIPRLINTKNGQTYSFEIAG